MEYIILYEIHNKTMENQGFLNEYTFNKLFTTYEEANKQTHILEDIDAINNIYNEYYIKKIKYKKEN